MPSAWPLSDCWPVTNPKHDPHLRFIGVGNTPSWWPERPAWEVTKAVWTPPPEGTVKVKAAQLFGEGKGLRLPMVGGPFHGEQIATHFQLRSGRGKQTKHLSVPVGSPITVKVDDGTKGTYVLADDGSAYVWWPAEG